MSVLVIAEHDQKSLAQSTLATLQAALTLNKTVDVLLAGFNCQTVLENLKALQICRTIFLANHESLQRPLAESFAPLIVDLAKSYDHILMPSTTFGKNIMPRVAAMLDVAQISDVSEIIDSNTFKRPIYAGNAIATVSCNDPKKCLTIRPTAFDLAKKAEVISEVKPIDVQINNHLSKFIEARVQDKTKPQLASAKIIISGGRGLGDKANFNRLEKIAEKMGAAIGATRAAVDAGLAPNEYQVGQTGQVVAPELYFAVGISGAIQHLAGMKDSKIIVAINKDPEAPIFEIADYGLVADLIDVLAQWEAMLQI